MDRDWTYDAHGDGEPFPTHCWCGKPVQDAFDHGCRQCAEHCEIERYRREAATAGTG